MCVISSICEDEAWLKQMAESEPTPVMLHDHTTTTAMDISSLAIALRSGSTSQMAHMCKDAVGGNLSLAPKLMKAAQVQSAFLDMLVDKRKEEMRLMLGEEPVTPGNVRVEDLLDIAGTIAERVGPDPFPLDNVDAYHPDYPHTWGGATWEKEKEWKKAFIATHILVTILDFVNPRLPRGRVPYISGPPLTGVWLCSPLPVLN